MQFEQDTLPPHCPEAERGVLGCCLLDTTKTVVALKAGVNTRWFFDLRHAEVFNVLTSMAANGGGDAVAATFMLRDRGQLEGIGGLSYLNDLQNAVPSAEDIEYYILPLLNSMESLAVTTGAAEFFELLKALEGAETVQKSVIDGKWEQKRRQSRNSNHENDQ